MKLVKIPELLRLSRDVLYGVSTNNFIPNDFWVRRRDFQIIITKIDIGL